MVVSWDSTWLNTAIYTSGRVPLVQHIWQGCGGAGGTELVTVAVPDTETPPDPLSDLLPKINMAEPDTEIPPTVSY